MGVKTYAGESPVPETYAGPMPWWFTAGNADSEARGKILERRLRGAEMLEAANVGWTVSKQPLFTLPGLMVDAEAEEHLRATGQMTDEGLVTVPGWEAIRRDTDGQFLGMVTSTYEPVQNEVLADVGDAFLEAAGNAHYETAGSLYDGKLVWMLAKIDREAYIKGDGSPLHDYLAIFTGHDGRHALTILNTPVRIWCGNTMAMAMEGATARVTLRHTTRVMDRIDEARAALDIHRKYFDTYIDAMNELAKRPMTLAEIERFTEVLLPTNPDVDKPFKTERQRAEILEVAKASPNLRDVPMTAYRAFQAVAEYADQVKPYGDTKVGKGADRRAVSAIEGNAFNMKTTALDLLVKA